MKHALLLAGLGLLLSSAQAATPAEATPVEAALDAVAALAQVNGQALACQDREAARRTKALMLAHAPRTARFGEAYENGTQQAFLATTQGRPACADPAQRAAQLDALAARLQAVLPASVP